MTSDADIHWFHDYFADVNTMQIEKMAAWFAEDVIVRFGNEPVMRGKKAALEAIGGLWTNFTSLTHAHGRIISDGAYFSGRRDRDLRPRGWPESQHSRHHHSRTPVAVWSRG
jgi:hypothetical protein